MTIDSSEMTVNEFKICIKTLLEGIDRNNTPRREVLAEAKKQDSEWTNKWLSTNPGNKKADAKKDKGYPHNVDNMMKAYRQAHIEEVRNFHAFYLHGSPGIGKSATIKQLAIDLKMDFKDIRLTTLDPVDLRGIPAIDLKNSVARWLQPGFLPKANPKSDRGGILLIDEINAVPPTMQASAYQLVLDKAIGEYVLPDKWIIIVAGNKMSDRSVTYKLPSALANRFTHIELKVDMYEWLDWARDNIHDPFVINFIRMGMSATDSVSIDTDKLSKSGNVLFNFNPKSGDTAFATPRSWEFVSKLKYLMEVNFPLYTKLVNGTIGSTVGDMFYQFIMHKNDIVDPNIILNGESYEMPQEIDTQYIMNSVLLTSLEGDMSVNRLDNYISNFVNKFERTNKQDLMLIYLKDLLAKFGRDYDNTLLVSKEFDKLITKYREDLVPKRKIR